MINTRLIGLAASAKKYVFLNVLLQWLGLLANAVIVFAVANFIGAAAGGALPGGELSAEAAGGGIMSGVWGPGGIMAGNGLAATLLLAGGAALARLAAGMGAAGASFRASNGVKKLLRGKIYAKLLELGGGYTETLPTAEALQTATEGVDQVEAYFGKYLPQFFYSMLAPLTLFVILAPLSLPAAALLLACAPLIPLLILMIMKMARKMLKRQWKSYVTLGDIFLENLQGMTALKVYAADGARQEKMRAEAERFRVSTMRVLKMQLNSIIIMDIIAFGGAALGVILAARGYLAGGLDLAGALIIALLSAEFFIPLRLLGSYFHIAMNGLAACERMFHILDLPAPADGRETLPKGGLTVAMRETTFAYTPDRLALAGVTLDLRPGGLVALVGVSGSGKSTAAALLAGRRAGYGGGVTVGGATVDGATVDGATVGGVQLRDVSRASLRDRITLVAHDGHVFAGTVADNLRLAREDAGDEELLAALERVGLRAYFAGLRGLDTKIAERGANLSGGQRQRLTIARALLRDSDVYIFDEAASNIDVESEAAIMTAVGQLAATKTVLLITHRLANAIPSKTIYLLEDGKVTESGTHEELLARAGAYARLFWEQRALEEYGGGAA
ncbi:MAG: ATP-binding cassette domain-containing protein [Peptococcaceae bacterium]|jgi:ABC-type transport system involved in cytochrome bd biosynthesis fused ATPase/permease subunit|nr:ATP-binding cassette domain-containing protein [Peptococcaceae bacterium]